MKIKRRQIWGNLRKINDQSWGDNQGRLSGRLLHPSDFLFILFAMVLSEWPFKNLKLITSLPFLKLFSSSLLEDVFKLHRKSTSPSLPSLSLSVWSSFLLFLFLTFYPSEIILSYLQSCEYSHAILFPSLLEKVCLIIKINIYIEITVNLVALFTF